LIYITNVVLKSYNLYYVKQAQCRLSPLKRRSQTYNMKNNENKKSPDERLLITVENLITDIEFTYREQQKIDRCDKFAKERGITNYIKLPNPYDTDGLFLPSCG